MYNQYRVSCRSVKGGDGGGENMVLLQEAWVHDETIIEALNFLEGVRVNVINRNYKILPTFQANFFYVMFCIIALQRTTHQP